MPIQVVQHDSIIPETEPDATSDEVQFRERHTKLKNDVQWEERLIWGDEEVNGRLKRKKGPPTDPATREGRAHYLARRGTYLINGRLVDPVPGGVLNHRPPVILRATLLNSPLTRMTKARTRRMIANTHHRFPSLVLRGGNPILIGSSEVAVTKTTARIML